MAIEISHPLGNVKRNVVQSVRAFSVSSLQESAVALKQHFLFANLANTQTKQEVIESIATQFTLFLENAKNFDVLRSQLTDVLNRAGMQAGFVIVLEHIPVSTRFDREVREQLLDAFREIADFWADKGVACRVFYSFAVARNAKMVANACCVPPSASSIDQATDCEDIERMPTDKILDVSPFALRMSSPFNPDYWLTAA